MTHLDILKIIVEQENVKSIQDESLDIQQYRNLCKCSGK
jgi:hypothetical protein